MLHIKSSCPALVCIDKEYLLDSEISSADFLEQKLIIKHYPISIESKSYIPSTIMLDPTKLKNCKNYSVTTFPNNHTEIILHPFTLPPSLVFSQESQKIENSTKTLYLYHSKTTTIAIRTESKFTFCDCEKLLSFKKAVEIDNIMHLLFDCEENLFYIRISQGKIIYKDFLQKATFSQNKLVGILPNFDMSGSGLAIEITFVKPYTCDQKSIYIEKQPKIVTDLRLIPFAFVESIKAKNYKLARQYITKNMSSRLSDDILSGFFGNIINISHDIYNDKLAVITKKEEIFVAKDYEFEFENGKISNINEL